MMASFMNRGGIKRRKVHSRAVFSALSIRLSFRHSLNLKEFLKAISMLSYVRVYGQAWCLLA